MSRANLNKPFTIVVAIAFLSLFLMQLPQSTISIMDAISAERGRISRQLQRSATERDRLLFQAEIVSLHEQEQELFRQLTGSNECFASSAFEAASNTNVWLWEEGAIWMVALYQSGQFKMIQVPPSAQPGVKKAISEVDLPQIERLLGTSIAFH